MNGIEEVGLAHAIPAAKPNDSFSKTEFLVKIVFELVKGYGMKFQAHKLQKYRSLWFREVSGLWFMVFGSQGKDCFFLEKMHKMESFEVSHKMTFHKCAWQNNSIYVLVNHKP